MDNKPGFKNDQIRNTFIANGLIGVVLVTLMAVLGETGWIGDGFLSILLKISVPIILMSIYFYWYWSSRIGSEFEYEFADSFYYMGFILTLWALLISFVWGALQGEMGNANAIIGNLGVALSTTIYGLAVRVMLISFEPNSDTTMEQINKDLQRSSTLLYQNVQNIGDRLEELGKNKFTALGVEVESLSVRFRELSSPVEHLKSHLRESSETLEKQSASTETLTKSTLTLADALGGVRLVLDNVEQSFQSTAESFSHTGERVASAGETVEGAVTDQVNFLRQVVTAYEGLDRVISEIGNTLSGETKKLSESLQGLGSSVAESKGSWENQSESLGQEVRSKIERVITDEAENLSGVLQGLIKAISESKNSWENQSGAVLKMGVIAEASAKSFEAMAGSLNLVESSTNTIGRITLGLEKIEKGLEKTAQIDFEERAETAMLVVEKSAQTVSEGVSTLKSLSENISIYITETSALISKVEESLVQNLETLNKEIRKK